MHRSLASVIVGITLLSACAGSPPPAPPGGGPTPESGARPARTFVIGTPGPGAQRLSGGARIERMGLGAQLLATEMVVGDDSLTVPINSSDPALQQLAYAQPGDHIISAPTEAAPDGLLVEVTDAYTSGDSMVISTTETSLEETVSDLTLEEDFEMPVNSLQSLTFADGSTYVLKPEDFLPGGLTSQNVQPQGSFGIPGINKDFSQLIGTCGDGKVGLTGKLNSNLKGFLNVKIGFFTLKKVEAGVKLAQGSNLTLGVECKEAFSREWPLVTMNYGTYVIWVGPIPIVVKPKVEVNAGASGQVNAKVSFAVAATSGGTLGLGWYKGDGFKVINTTSSTFTQTLSMSGGGSLRGWVGAKAGFSFYGGLAYVYGYPKAFVEGKINADLLTSTLSYCLDAGLGLTAGGHLKVFGKTLGKKEFDLGEMRQHLLCGSTVWGGETVTPAPTPTPPPPPPTEPVDPIWPRPCEYCHIP